jgi:hypothetical protein
MFSVLLRKPGGMPTASFRGHDLTVPRGACPREQRRGHATRHMDVDTLSTCGWLHLGAVPSRGRPCHKGGDAGGDSDFVKFSEGSSVVR